MREIDGGRPPIHADRSPVRLVPVRTLLQTPLHAAHLAAGARMVEFAGYDMPVQYADGVLKEHLWTRARAGAFDVSHMGPAFLTLNKKRRRRRRPTTAAVAAHRRAVGLAATSPD